MIPASFIQDLLQRVDIVEVVSRYVTLKKGGANYLGLCPFHHEKSPSFTVAPSKQFYHCFGCGANGTAIGFLMNFTGSDFVETVHDLAHSLGMSVPQDEVSRKETQFQRQQQLALSEVMTRASDFYQKQLSQTPAAIDYLKKRGVTGEIAGRYRLGFAHSGWNNLKAVFDNYQVPELVEAGLVIEKEAEPAANNHSASASKKRYDRFRERIIFPIRNTKGLVIGFGGRVLDQGEPKYLNSPETPLFQKGNELYGLFEARQKIREAGYVLVTEGYMDVIALAQWGFGQAVATLGTACTPAHVQKLLRQTDQIIFAFDGDAAGQRAARRALENSLTHLSDQHTLRFLFLPAEHDPDSYIRVLGEAAFQQQVVQSLPLSQFLIKIVTAEHDLKTAEGRAQAQFSAKPFLQSLSAPLLRLQIVRALAQLTQTTAAEIESLLQLSPSTPQRRARPTGKRTPPVGMERHVMRLLLAHPPLVQAIDAESLAAFQAISADRAQLLMQLIEVCNSVAIQASQVSSFAAITEQLRHIDPEFNRLIAEVAPQSESTLEIMQAELNGALIQVKTRALKLELDQLAAQGLSSDEGQERYRHLMRRQEQLRQLQAQEKENET